MTVSLKNILKYFIYFSILTTSFDIFLVFNLGFNFRISQLMLFAPFLYIGIQALRKNKLYLPLGFKYLLTWCFFIVLFIPNSYGFIRGFGYAFWLIFSIILIIAFVNFFRKRSQVESLFKFYIYSFFFVAIFGLIQFILPLIGLPTPLVTQWWIPDLIARINGFSYEPSYYATYMVMGFVITGYLLRIGSKLFDISRLRLIHYTILLVLILCTSRMGWVMMVLWYATYPIFFPPKFLQGKLNLNFLKSTMTLGGVAVSGILVLVYFIGFDNFKFLLSGIGIGDMSAHSASQRTSSLIDTLQVFANNPVIGVSLGGIAPHIAAMEGYTNLTFDILKAHEGMMVFAEVLAASGIIGFIPFVLYFYQIFMKPFQLIQRLNNKLLKQMLGAMLWALLFELIILQFNQNIMRSFLWMHIAILSVMYGVFIRESIKGIKVYKGKV